MIHTQNSVSADACDEKKKAELQFFTVEAF
jgi:hypothetical protein